jgi:hypothetical protein
VDMAEACLALDSARLYGLVTGGPKVNVDRCEELLERGRARGTRPRKDAIERFMEALRAAGQVEAPTAACARKT